MTQGVLPFQYELERSTQGMTALAGLPAYLDLAVASGLTASVARHMKVCAWHSQGWTDTQVVMPLVLLNVAGGDCVEDMRVLEGDEGFVRVLRRVELHGLPRRQRRKQERQWRKERRRAVPSASVVFRYLSAFHNEAEEGKREEGHAFIPAPNEHLRGLGMVNRELVCFRQRRAPQRQATLDTDASLVETFKEGALWCYQGYKAYQPVTTYWAEQDVVVHSEFRDGNVPAGHELLRLLQEALEALPPGVDTVFYRGDTAAYQQDLLRYCAEGKSHRFGRIEFTVGVDVTLAFKEAVAGVAPEEWRPLEREVDGKKLPTGQERAEVCFVPNWAGRQKTGPDYRFLATREPLAQSELPGMEDSQLPFPTMTLGEQRYKVHGIVTNRTLPGDEVIWWHRQRCGKGEEVHSVLKEDLAGGKLPSAKFGANAAWWQIAVLAFNLNSIMKHLVLPREWAHKRLKAIRFGLIHVAGRVLERARCLAVRLSTKHPSYELLLMMRGRILALARAP